MSNIFTKHKVERLLNQIKNKKLKDIDIAGVLVKANQIHINTGHIDKGIPGNVIEQSVLGLQADSKQSPDLLIDNCNVELKTTGLILRQRDMKYDAKERVSITGVSIDKIGSQKNFWESFCYHKLEHILFVFYDYVYKGDKKNINVSDYGEFPILDYSFYEFSKEDMYIISKDWELVRDFIVDVQENNKDIEIEYPKISTILNKEMQILETVPKYPNPPRFALKKSVMKTIIHEILYGQLEVIPSIIGYKDIDKKINDITKENMGISLVNLAYKYKINIEDKKFINKALAEQITVKMFGGNSKRINSLEVFSKYGLIAKTITLKKNGNNTEDMKLFRVDFNEFLLDYDFEESELFDYFNDYRLLVIIFQEDYEGQSYKDVKFKGFKVLSFKDNIDTLVKPTWLELKRLIIEDDLREKIVCFKGTNKPIYSKSGIIRSMVNFPKSADYPVFLRGSSSNATNKIFELNGIKMYPQYYWIKGRIISDLINE